MITEVTMPAMGADMTEGTIVKWLKTEGDQVKRGDKLAEIETDKTVVEMEAYGEGVLRKIVIDEGGKVPVGDLIAYIGAPEDEVPGDGAAPQAEAEPSTDGQAPTTEAQPAEPQAQEAPPTPEARQPVSQDGAEERVKASPIARRLAQERGIDLAQITGTGPGGRITREDVEGFQPEAARPAAAAGEAPAPAARPPQLTGEDIPLTSMRQTIAKVTVRSKSQAPHFYVTTSVNMTEAMKLRKGVNVALADNGMRVSVNDMIIKATVMALLKHPKFNSFFDGDKLVGHSDINMGIAIALEAGLIVPAIMRCQGKTLQQISQEARDLGRRARNGGLAQEELTSATFSISNLGMFDVENFIAIIVPPQAGILATGRVERQPVVAENDEIVAADVMKATVSVDHRVADGAEAAVFLGEIKKALENPASLLL